MTESLLRPGDFAVVSSPGRGGRLITFLEWANGDGFGPYGHAFIYMGDGKICQAKPSGAAIDPIGTYDTILWSSGIIPLTEGQRVAITAYAAHVANMHTGYSWADYAALAAKRLRIPFPHLKAYIAGSGHQICSQLVDSAYVAAGVHLFDDGRWPGMVTPMDLANRIAGSQS